MSSVAIIPAYLKSSLALFLCSLLGALLLISCSSTSELESVEQTRPGEAEEIDDFFDEVIVTARREEGNPRAQGREGRRREQEQAIADLQHQSELLRNRQRTIERQEILSPRVDPSMVFKHYGVNPTIDTVEESTSTFSIDVDTASYHISREFLQRGVLPDPAAIRVEEFVNAFDYGYETPLDDDFALHADVFPSPYRRGYHVLHLGVQATEGEFADRKASHITLLVDVSGSMARGRRLEMVKRALDRLVANLDAADRVSLVTYSNDATLLLPSTSAVNIRKINRAITILEPEDSTNIQAGLELAYQIANEHYHPDLNNRIILYSDGVANSGEIDPEQMFRRISDESKRGIYLNTIGVGMGNYNDVILETLAQRGQGHYNYINSMTDASRQSSQKFLSHLHILARDVRLQVEFDVEQVERFRLLGYENRAMDNADFFNANKDAGEIGLGHAVTAVYEIKFRHTVPSSSFGTFRVAFKTPQSELLNSVQKDLPASIICDKAASASAGAQLSYIAAMFAEKLRGTYWSRTYNYQQLQRWTKTIRKSVARRDQANALAGLIRSARRLDERPDSYQHRVSLRAMSFDRVPVLE